MPLWLDPHPLVLGSRSSARRDMLAATGIPVELAPTDIDERGVEARAGAMGPSDAAILLAREKARVAGANFTGRFVIGADQTLALGDRRFSKAKDRASARETLRALSGKTHELHSAVAVSTDGRVVFSAVDTARMTMRSLSDRYIETYLDEAGDGVRSSVGVYHLEKLGIQLFEKIEGDHFTILGMPLFALLAFLRREGRLAS
jgi:septum formation protein